MYDKKTDRNYGDWVRTLPCCITGITGETIVSHHAIGISYLTGHGMGMKGRILSQMPMTSELHQELHQMGHRSFENKYNFSQEEAMLKTIFQAERDEVITF